ncbi:MAG: hypothetical protein E7302_17050 [Butyrivibrio sp.]|nr:hypothetical protein [Butyrivibrio sp.]
MKKKISICLVLAFIFCLNACSYDFAELEEKHRIEHEEMCDRVMNEMEIRLSEKYSGILGNDPDEVVFDVYDISKGGHKAWFQSGFYPAKAVNKDNDEEFTVQIDITIPNAKGFGDMEDSFYGVLYGKDVKDELYDLVESYGVEDVNIYYEPCKDILTDQKDLREHLTVFGNYKLESYDDIDIVCELANELNEFGCNNRISADGRDIGEGAEGIAGKTSDEIREFFEKRRYE